MSDTTTPADRTPAGTAVAETGPSRIDDVPGVQLATPTLDAHRGAVIDYCINRGVR